jgi:hypothetical protein
VQVVIVVRDGHLILYVGEESVSGLGVVGVQR